ncbi:restriction endonuclease subunit S [Streptomyces cavernicola]|uniref:Restriction endonuclease subunit S n=1 Tax=Streptomyces cavernicola TaxID=3043613 RepID=A0ABT6S4T3_9ACTN|nr:restriction endonuclease subunit S [Streptomyces sp. B-S-A6]MDI3402428.1 restriction endonuclease subunit S [Streptomyces sp. B-S-A6]
MAADSYTASGTRLIRTSDIAADGSLRDAEFGIFVEEAVGPRHELQSGDILLSRSGTLGRSFLVPEEANGHTYAGFLIRFRPRKSVEPRFLSYVTQSVKFQEAVHSQAVASTIQNFNADRYANIPMCAPALEEQCRIADFLDAETARIGLMVRLRDRQIRLTEERASSALEDAFNRASHKLTRLKYLLAVKPRYGVLVPQFADAGVRFIRVNDLLDLPGRAESLAKIPDSLSAQYARTVARPGDVLLSVVGTMGRSAVVPPELAGANVARAVASLRPQTGVSPQLMSTWLTTPSFLRQAVDVTSSDTAQPTLGMEDLGNFNLSWPVAAESQEDLLRATGAIRERRDNLVQLLRGQLQLLAERRQALITAAVTGQFDVSTASGRNVTDGVTAS